MARSTLSRDTARALVPVVVPLVTKVVLPIFLESLRRRGKFDADEFLEEAAGSLKKGIKKARPALEDVRDEVVERGSELYEEARKQGAELVDLLARKGARFAEDWLEGARPRRRRRFPWGLALGILAVAGVAVAIAGRK